MIQCGNLWYSKTRRVNNTGSNIRYKPGERRERQKAKAKQEDFTKTDYQEEFPQLGASPSKAPKVAKQPAPISNQKPSPTVNKADVVRLQTKPIEETTLKHKDSAPVESPQNKVDPYSSQKPATKTPQPPARSFKSKSGSSCSTSCSDAWNAAKYDANAVHAEYDDDASDGHEPANGHESSLCNASSYGISIPCSKCAATS